MKKLFAIYIHEVRLILPTTIFFFLAFMLIATTQRLILLEYHVPLTGYAAALIGALIVGKVVLIMDKFRFINKFPEHPLIYNIVWKSTIYFIATLIFRYVEHLISFLRKHDNFIEANRHLWDEIVWPHFWLIQMWLGVLFFLYCTIRELIRVIGKKEIRRIFIGARSHGN
jgi:hypothetical protein